MNITLADTLAERIRDLRTARGLTQADLARNLHVTRSGVNSWETGASMPSLESLIRLAAFFHVSTDYLLGINPAMQLDITEFSFDEQELIQRLMQYIQFMNEKLLKNKHQ